MKIPGFWVIPSATSVRLERVGFDETELDPDTQWQQAWQNQDVSIPIRGYTQLDVALRYAAQCFAKSEGRTLDASELMLVGSYEPEWMDNDSCEINSLTTLLKGIP